MVRKDILDSIESTFTIVDNPFEGIDRKAIDRLMFSAWDLSPHGFRCAIPIILMRIVNNPEMLTDKIDSPGGMFLVFLSEVSPESEYGKYLFSELTDNEKDCVANSLAYLDLAIDDSLDSMGLSGISRKWRASVTT